ncbi:RING-H2 finger protein ATL3-like [Lucilia cuprina]|uniref:RING-H2 finger protein ATL3-like n=1 Tax=Lucilia cuprina TaxID=7375 RepID=UPI001F0511FC|nr:RING-H2 finger protein ATL3-like [Lucilia cuprina]
MAMLERSPPPSSAMPEVYNESLCMVCNKNMSDGQECLIMSECNHSFHRICIEKYLSHSTECPCCKRPCALSELKAVSFSENSQPIEKSKVFTPKTRGVVAKHYNTRKNAKTLFNEPQTPSVEFRSEISTARPNNTPQITRLISMSDNKAQNNPLIANKETNSQNNSITIDPSQLTSLIENTVTCLLQNLNIAQPSQNLMDNRNFPPSHARQPLDLPNSTNYTHNRYRNSNIRQFSHNSVSFDENFAIRFR